jgi:demethoxyubiquinone hydroxylase (CLK1/Coq7/Cat5 family)
MFAGPEQDGSVKTERVVLNIASLAGDDAVPSLAQWLYEYAAFALFAATSLVSKEVEQALTRQVSEMIGPLQQTKDDEGGPGSRVSIHID